VPSFKEEKVEPNGNSGAEFEKYVDSLFNPIEAEEPEEQEEE